MIGGFFNPDIDEFLIADKRLREYWGESFDDERSSPVRFSDARVGNLAIIGIDSSDEGILDGLHHVIVIHPDDDSIMVVNDADL